MPDNHREEPNGIRRKRRRAPMSLEDIERQRNVRIEDINSKPRDERNKLSFSDNLKKFRPKKILSVIGIIVAAILLIGLISMVRFFSKIDNNNTIASTAPSGNSVNFLLLGMDIGNTSNTTDMSLKRTDTMLIINYNKKTKAVQAISIPRDTLVTEAGSNYKINAAYIKGGDTKVKSVVDGLLGIQINYIVKIDYKAFRDFIDAIGGVDMEIEQNMIYDDDGQDLHINFKGGTTVHLDGKKAEEFFRWRKNNDGTGLATGDLGRIENQHKFIQKVVNKCKSPTIIFKAPKILNSVAENMDTNLTSIEMIDYGTKFLTSKGVEMKTLQGTPKTIRGQSYFVFEKSKNKQLLDSLSSGQISSSSSTNNISDCKIMVLNGTKINGLAGRVKTQLQVFGLNNVDTGNTDISEKTIVKTNNKEIKKALKNNMSGIDKFESISDDSKYSSYDAVIIIGKDYKKLGE